MKPPFPDLGFYLHIVFFPFVTPRVSRNKKFVYTISVQEKKKKNICYKVLTFPQRVSSLSVYITMTSGLLFTTEAK